MRYGLTLHYACVAKYVKLDGYSGITIIIMGEGECRTVHYATV